MNRSQALKKNTVFSQELATCFVERGIISAGQMSVVLQEQSLNGTPFEESLINLGFISESALTEALSNISGYESVDLKSTLFDPNLKQSISKTLAEKYTLIPLSLENGLLKIAIADVYNFTVFDELCYTIPGVNEVIPFIAPESEILQAIDVFYGHDLSIPALIREIETSSLHAQMNPTIRLVNSILIDAIKLNASDIHFEPEGSFMRLRYRIDGILSQICTLHSSYWPALCVRIKVMSEMNIAESRRPQNGRITFYIGSREIDLRVASHPPLHGENVVIRILDKSRSLIAIDKLGYSKKMISQIKKTLERPEGLFIITGPTGSGKTTSLYSLLNYISSPTLNIMTLEEPVEYKLPLIRQTDIKDQVSISFADGVRSILRQDPDIILVGEIRDQETAQMALRASMTGHQVFATLHTNDALGAIPRLFELGLSRTVVSGNILGIIAQRLIRKLCSNCKQPKQASPYESILLKSKKPFKLYEPKGCPMCRGMGYQGRLAIAEMIVFDTELNETVLESVPKAKIKSLCEKKGFVSMQREARMRIINGDSSLQEVTRVIDLHEEL